MFKSCYEYQDWKEAHKPMENNTATKPMSRDEFLKLYPEIPTNRVHESTEQAWEDNCCDTLRQDFAVGDKVADRDGYTGTIVNVTVYKDSLWYTVRLNAGDVVRFNSELTAVRKAS